MKRACVQVPDRATAWGYLVTNATVLPGAGSVMAGRRVGYAQAGLALTGFGLTLWFAGAFLWQCWAARALVMPAMRELVTGAAGVLLFVMGWLWALATSLALLRSAPPEAPSRPGGEKE